MGIKLFISHSHADSIVAGSLVRLIKESFTNVSDSNIRCTSNKGTGYLVGDNLTNEIKKEIQNSFVIVIQTANSMNRSWVLWEMGAAWASAKNTAIIYGTGLSLHDLEGPFRDTLVASLSSRDQMRDLIFAINDKVGGLNISPKLESALDSYIKEIGTARIERKFDAIIFRKQLTEERYGLRWKQILEDATSSVSIIGWSCSNIWSAGTGGMWEEYLKSGRKLNILFQDYRIFEGKNGPIVGHICNKDGNIDVVRDIRESEANFRLRREQYPDNIEAKKTRNLIAWSGVLIDHDRPEGFGHFEVYNAGDPYDEGKDKHLNMRLNYVISANSAFFTAFKNSFKFLWSTGVLIK